eukprot:CAMPEP_0202467354 /NCGR_PEP_ID=MMETSP1360-20130828/71695_1 /ASSEMBLY_ACC=CAM_ASM_000848 /TAXON_ID=515479 /ORGANISM="Licmophora paradoxa, Strain CCMP2313" /LENGTH=198 /DNA_ID=CAMNT_0049091865 /DNA_START=82 /DNA_END=675 /DNA_ORIENTATION=+
MAISVITLASLSTVTAQVEELQESYLGEFKNFIQPILLVVTSSILFIIAVYSQVAPYTFLKNYKRIGQSAEGHVLSCEENENGNYDMAVLFKYGGTRFLRRAVSSKQKQRGAPIDFLVIPGCAQTALPKEMVEHELSLHSHSKTAITILGGLFMCGLVWAYVHEKARQMENPRLASLVLIVAYNTSVAAGLAIGGNRW